jgi:hypothetical protein
LRLDRDAGASRGLDQPQTRRLDGGGGHRGGAALAGLPDARCRAPRLGIGNGIETYADLAAALADERR